MPPRRKITNILKFHRNSFGRTHIIHFQCFSERATLFFLKICLEIHFRNNPYFKTQYAHWILRRFISKQVLIEIIRVRLFFIPSSFGTLSQTLLKDREQDSSVLFFKLQHHFYLIAINSRIFYSLHSSFRTRTLNR